VRWRGSDCWFGRILRFLTGKQISEYALLVTLRIACNLLYVSTVLFGFIFLPKNVMIVVGIMTSLIGELALRPVNPCCMPSPSPELSNLCLVRVPGPLIALLMIGIFIAFIGVFVYAPCISMNVICICIFCSGPVSLSPLPILSKEQEQAVEKQYSDDCTMRARSKSIGGRCWEFLRSMARLPVLSHVVLL